MFIVLFTIAWFAGLWLASILEVPLSYYGFAAASCLAIIAGPGRRRPALRFGPGLLIAFSLAGGRHTLAQPAIDGTHIATYNGTPAVTLTGVVVAEPDVRDLTRNLRLAVEHLDLPDGRSLQVRGLVLVRAERYPEIIYGTRLRLRGRLEIPPEDEDFSYREYLRRRGIHSLMNRPYLEVLAKNAGNPLYARLFRLKEQARRVIVRQVSEPQAALLTGILLGDDNGIPPDLAAAFRATGLTHIIAISGFNIALLIGILVGLGRPILSRRGATVFALVGIALYTILVGAEASVVRAAIMGGLYLFSSRWLGRPTYIFASLFLAGLLMTLANPFTLWDVGFQLSFMATLSLMLYADPFTRWTEAHLTRYLGRRWTRRAMGLLSEAVVITIAAQVLTLPLMIGYFGQLSLISLLANALVLPVQPAVMTWGGLATLTGLVLPPLGQALAWIAWLPLAYTIVLVRVLSGVPGAAVPVEVPTAGVVLLYGLIGILTWLSRQPAARRARWINGLRHHLKPRLALGASLSAALLVFSFGATQPDGNLHIAFMDVGQGDATFIQTPTGRQILIDGGLYPSVLNDRLGRQVPFWDREIDLVIATHPDADHVAGLVGVFDRYRVGRLITDGEGLGASPIYDAVLNAAEERETPIQRARAGEVLEFGDGVRLEVLHPGPELDGETRNDNSVSVRLVFGDFTYLSTGDAEEAAERTMQSSGLPLSAVVFKAGHHGSNSSSSAPFLQAVGPQFVIVSAGKDNQFGHPHPAMLRRAWDVGAAVLRTDELGTIEVVTDGRRMWWQARPD